MTHRCLPSAFRLFFILLVLTLSSSGFAQKEEGDFSQEFTAASAKFGIPFIIEEGMFPARCDTQITIPENATETQTIQALAARWELEAERRPGVILFRKRFSRDEDIPFVSLAEWHVAMRETATLLDNFFPASDSLSSQQALIESITPEQREPLKRGMLVSALTPRQKELLWQCASTMHGGMFAMSVRMQQQTVREFLTKERYFVRTSDERYPLNSRTKKQQEPFTPHPAGFSRSNLLAVDGGEVKLTEVTIAETGLVRVSLESARAQWGDKAAIDTAIKNTPVSVFAAHLSPQRFVAGVARLYGYRAVRESNDTWRLTRQSVALAPDIGWLPYALRHSLPLTLRRYLFLERMPQTAAPSASGERQQGGNGNSKSASLATEQQSLREAMHRRCRMMAKFGVSLVMACLTAKEAKKSVPLLVEEGVATAVLIPEGVLGLEGILLSEPPGFLTHFPESVIQINSPGPNTFEIRLSLEKRDGDSVSTSLFTIAVRTGQRPGVP